MSISDLILVMKDGVLHQAGKPQEVYEDPADLFVATFLGTPPINMFEGTVRDGKLCIGQEPILNTPGVEDQSVSVGIRPEGFIPCADGCLTCILKGIEVMGRDISVLGAHEACSAPVIRAIVSADEQIATGSGVVRFALKPHKVLLFDTQGQRIRF